MIQCVCRGMRNRRTFRLKRAPQPQEPQVVDIAPSPLRDGTPPRVFMGRRSARRMLAVIGNLSPRKFIGPPIGFLQLRVGPNTRCHICLGSLSNEESAGHKLGFRHLLTRVNHRGQLAFNVTERIRNNASVQHSALNSSN